MILVGHIGPEGNKAIRIDVCDTLLSLAVAGPAFPFREPSRMSKGRGRLPRGRTMLLQGRRAQLLVGCAQPPRRPILCRRHSERGFEQSAKMGGIIETPPIANLGYGGLGIRSV
jgi:hypothetical protein